MVSERICRNSGLLSLASLAHSEFEGLKALPHFQAATHLLPKDQIAWIGLADACRQVGNAKNATDAYRVAVEINPHSDLAEQARAGSNALSQSGFDKVRQVTPRQDAVHYCLGAMQQLSNMDAAELKKLTLELAMVGRNGFEVQNPASRYRVKGLEGEFSGLAMVCFLYVAMQRIAPGTDIGFDLAEEYEIAKRMFASPG